MSSDNLAVWVDDSLACVKITGRAGCECSVDFRKLILSLRDKGWRRFVLDLTDCQLMDSTFLGVLAGLGIRFSEEPAAPSRAAIELLNPSTRIAALLENLGVNDLFPVLKGERIAGGPFESVPPSPGQPDRAELQRTSLAAHQLLCKLDPKNEAKFKDVCKFLEEDLKKLERKSGEPPPNPS